MSEKKCWVAGCNHKAARSGLCKLHETCKTSTLSKLHLKTVEADKKSKKAEIESLWVG